MYLIVGLGNPEPEYSKTRHNMGFDVINKISEKFGINVNKTKFNALYGTGTIGTEKVVLVKPQTYMNSSGEAIQEFVNFYKIENNKILVICDDIDTIPGRIRIRKCGGPGTHNGMKSVVECLGTEDFPRIRIGVGMPQFKSDLINHVINKMSDENYEELKTGIDSASEAVESILKIGIDKSMNVYN